MINKEQIATWEVLAVDDEPDSLEVIKRVLLFYGANVRVATDGAEALAMLDEFVPTIIFTDLSMPEMDGWELLYEVKSKPEIANVPVVALTAHAMDGDEERALRAGFLYYLTKPLSPRSFLQDLDVMFSRNPQEAKSFGYVPDVR